jgi:hypothetical protein
LEPRSIWFPKRLQTRTIEEVKRLLIITGPQGSGNHLFSKVFATSEQTFGWSGLLDVIWQGHHEEPFAEYWQTPSLLSSFDWDQKDYYVTSVSCPYFFNGVPVVPNYRAFVEEASKYVDNITIAIIGRDQNIVQLQQERVRGAPTLPLAKETISYLFENFSCEFLSQELLYLYKQDYVAWIAKQLDWPLDRHSPLLDVILAEDANNKYVKQSKGKLDEHIINASKNSFRTK